MNAQGVYENLEKYIDMDNYRDYYLTRIFLGVYDWPGNNRSVWRPIHDGGKFRNIIFDSDGALTYFEYDHLNHALVEDGELWPNPPWSTFVLRKLLQNKKFRDDFIQRNQVLASTVFRPDRLMHILDSFKALYQPLMEEQYLRWQYPGQDISTWRYFLSFYNDFIENRHCYIRSFFIERFGLPDSYMTGFGCTDENKKPKKSSVYLKQFPNPTTGDFTIGVQLNSARHIHIYITDLMGRTLYSKKLYVDNTHYVATITALRNISPGQYILTVESDDNAGTIKIIKQ
jgi:hypothetical protein